MALILALVLVNQKCRFQFFSFSFLKFPTFSFSYLNLPTAILFLVICNNTEFSPYFLTFYVCFILISRSHLLESTTVVLSFFIHIVQ